jgi:hypothetical protein
MKKLFYITLFFIGLFSQNEQLAQYYYIKVIFEGKISYEELLKEILRTHSIF